MNLSTPKLSGKRFWIGLLAGLWLLSALAEQSSPLDAGMSRDDAGPQIDVHDHIDTLISNPVYSH